MPRHTVACLATLVLVVALALAVGAQPTPALFEGSSFIYGNGEGLATANSSSTRPVTLLHLGTDTTYVLEARSFSLALNGTNVFSNQSLASTYTVAYFWSYYYDVSGFGETGVGINYKINSTGSINEILAEVDFISNVPCDSALVGRFVGVNGTVATRKSAFFHLELNGLPSSTVIVAEVTYRMTTSNGADVGSITDAANGLVRLRDGSLMLARSSVFSFATGPEYTLKKVGNAIDLTARWTLDDADAAGNAVVASVQVQLAESSASTLSALAVVRYLASFF